VIPLVSVVLGTEHDVVAVRQRARQVAALLGLEAQDQTRVATAVSEIARNAIQYAGGGRVEFAVEGETLPQLLLVTVTDKGPGIGSLKEILDGTYRSRTGMGLGIVGTRRLMDRFHVESAPGQGTRVLLRKILSRAGPLMDGRRAARLADELSRRPARSALEEVQQQNQELLRALDALRVRQEELVRLNGELEDTNRGVVALYAELDEKADHLRRADELKSRFLSNMSHEFRTPVNSVLALSRLLLDRVDGSLTPEQERQVLFIRKAAEDLTEIVNDLLDLAKVEAGKVVVRPTEFEVPNLFGALRGMLRPLLVSEHVQLVFDEIEDVPTMFTDEGKVSQILRNFISNALKFTEQGEVRVSAVLSGSGEAVVFSVADTGIGIAPEDQERIFEEFSQVESPVQRRVQGTGLGLPLSRRFARLLGGDVSVESVPHVGSTFRATIPLVYATAADGVAEPERVLLPDRDRTPVLVVENAPESLVIYDRFLRTSPFQLVTARSTAEARRALAQIRPAVIVLDILLQGEDSWAFLAELKNADGTRDIPVVVATTVDDRSKALALGADAYGKKPIDRAWFVRTLTRLSGAGRAPRALIVDDDPTSRYVLRQALRESVAGVVEAEGGEAGLRLARAEQPDIVFLDLVMPDLAGEAVLEALKADPATRDIPVVIVTSRHLDDEAREQLGKRAAGFLDKQHVSMESADTVLQAALADAGDAGGN
jgi:signal transduction histidine kinase/DNA-binding response OmpR family regulator